MIDKISLRYTNFENQIYYRQIIKNSDIFLLLGEY